MEHWDGTTWTLQSLPNPGGTDELFAVGGSASNLFAAGDYLDPQGVFRTLVMHCC